MRTLLLLALTASLACTKTEAPPPPAPKGPPSLRADPAASAPAAPAAPRTASLVIGAGDPCALFVVAPSSGKRRALLKTGQTTCPDHLAFDASRRRVVYVEGDAVFAHVLGSPRKQIASGAWVSEVARMQITDDGVLHLISLTRLEDKDAKAETIDDKMRVTVTIDGVEKVFEDHFLPPWGTWNLADHRVIGPDGVVKLVERVPTKWEAGETPGPSVIELQKPLRAFSTSGQWDRGCPTKACQALPEPPKGVAARFAAAKHQDPDAVDVLPVTAAWTLAFKVEWGDTPHPTPPFAFCDATCTKLVELQGIDDEFPTLSVHPPWVLVGHSMHERAWVFRAGEAKASRVLEGARLALWVPFVL